MRSSWVVAIVLVSALAAAPARGDDLHVNTKVEAPLVLGGGVLYVLGEGPLKGALSPDDCRWCSPILFDDAVRDALVWDDRKAAHQASNLTGFAAAPLVALGGVGVAGGFHGRRWFEDSLIVVESAVLAADVNYLVKSAVGRERPFVHALPPADKPDTDYPQDNNLSFYSGHSTFSMAFAVSAGRVASLRGYRAAPYVWAGGVSIALATGYLRIAADKHWSTDVLVGWATGAAIGWIIPGLHRRASRLSVATSGRTVGVAYRW